MRRRGSTAAVLGLGAVALAAAVAVAHGFLERAEPRAGTTVRAAPAQVTVWFTGAVEPAYSRVQVFDAAGARVDVGDSRVDAANRAQVSVALRPALAPGRYRVKWRVLSVDGHVTDGEFSFTLAAR